MADVALPQRAAQRWGLILVRVFGGGPDRQHPSDADDHAARLFRQRRALGIKEAQRLVRTQCPKEGIEHHELVVALLHPCGVDFLALSVVDHRFAFRHPPELQRLRQTRHLLLGIALHVFAQHPTERHASGGVGPVHEARRRDVAVRFRIELGIGMRHRARQLERRHERHTLADAGRQVFDRNLVQRLSCAAQFDSVALALADAREDQATCIAGRVGTDRARPTTIVPWHTNRDVVHWQATRTRGKGFAGHRQCALVCCPPRLLSSPVLLGACARHCTTAAALALNAPGHPPCSSMTLSISAISRMVSVRATTIFW